MKNKNTITLNGIVSTEIPGLLIQELPAISKPLIRTEIEEIDGRDGDIVTQLGYAAYDKEISIGLYGDYDINQIAAYFNSKGTVTFSNEPDKYYNYEIINQIDFERLVRYRVATVTFHVQPFKYSTAEGEVVLDAPANNLITIPNYQNTSNGVTLTATDGIVTITGTPTAATEFYLPIESLVLDPGDYTLKATSSGTHPSNSSIRLIGSAPSNVDSFGGRYITLNVGTVTLQDILTAPKTYGYLWFYVNPGQALDFDVTFELENNAEKSISGEGTSIALLNTAAAPFSRFDIKGDTAQAGTPTPDNPQPILSVRGQEMLRLTGRNLASSDEMMLGPGTERLSGGFRATIEADTLPTYYAPAITIPLGVYTVSFEAKSLNPESTVLVLGDTADMWGKTGLTLKDEDGQPADEAYRRLTDDWKRYSFTLVSDASYPWINDLAMILHFTTYVNSPVFTLRNFQLEVGDTATEFFGAAPQMYPIDLRTGKNFISPGYFIMGGLTAAMPVFSIQHRINNALAPVLVYPGTTYSISAGLWGNVQGVAVDVQECDANGIYLRDLGWQQLASGAYSFTVNPDAHYIKLCFALSTTSATVTEGSTEDTTAYTNPLEWLRGVTIQMEEGGATAYEPYETMELHRLDGRQDYITRTANDRWHFHKEIASLVLNGTEAWTYDSSLGVFFLTLNDAISTATRDVYAVSDRFVGVQSTNADSQWSAYANNSIALRYVEGTAPQLGVKTNLANTVAGWQNWLALNNVDMRYVLETATTTEITNAYTLQQLAGLKQYVHAYDGITFISSWPGASVILPPVISAAVVKASDGEVINSGNTTAKPTLTIYGEGDIAVVLNGFQVFQIALGDSDHITIDTAAMEAYKDSTNVLMNRQVTGDYNNFALNPGANQITFTGTVTKCVVANYSRWI